MRVPGPILVLLGWILVLALLPPPALGRGHGGGMGDGPGAGGMDGPGMGSEAGHDGPGGMGGTGATDHGAAGGGAMGGLGREDVAPGAGPGGFGESGMGPGPGHATPAYGDGSRAGMSGHSPRPSPPSSTGMGMGMGKGMMGPPGMPSSPNDRLSPTLLASGLDEAGVKQALALGFRLRARERLAGLGLQLVTLEPPLGVDLERAARLLEDRLPEAVVDFDHAYAPQGRAAAGGTCGGCWPQQLVGWPPAPACRAADPIALLDGRPALDHPALEGATIVLHPLATAPPSDHATALALLLVGRGFGLLPQMRLHAIAIYRATPQGPRAGARDLVRGLDLALRHGVRIALTPLAGPPNRLVALAVRKARARGLLVVAAAGNGGPYAPPAHPAALAQTVAVTAVDRTLQPWSAAARGPHVDFAAPGVGLTLPDPGGQLRRYDGTSFATPFVAAALALGRGIGLTDPERLLDDLARQALDLGPPGRDPLFGFGLIRPPGPCRAPRGTALSQH